MCPSAGSSARIINILQSRPRPCPVARMVPGPEGKAGLANFDQIRQRVALRVNHRRERCAGRAVRRCGTILSHAASAATTQGSCWNGSPPDRRPETGCSVAACWRAAVSRPSSEFAGRSRRTRRDGTCHAVPIPCHDRNRDTRNCPASASRSTRQRRPCRPGTDVEGGNAHWTRRNSEAVRVWDKRRTFRATHTQAVTTISSV